MAAPDFVPVAPGAPKYYVSPPRRPNGWRADRPGEVIGEQPDGAGMGHQGPDQGYALTLARQFESSVHLAAGEHWADVRAGVVAVALKRASLFGRAPVRADVELALTVWGYLDDSPDPDLVTMRRVAFEGVSNAHHYLELRRIVAAVPAGALRCTPAEASKRYSADWSLPLDLDVLVEEDADDR